jgi:hypothetical protein
MRSRPSPARFPTSICSPPSRAPALCLPRALPQPSVSGASAMAATEILRHRPGHRAQRQQALGALALTLPEVSAPDLRGVRRSIAAALLLGKGLLRAAAQPRILPPSSPARTRLQMDPHHVPLLAEPHALRRGQVSERPQVRFETPSAAANSAGESPVLSRTRTTNDLGYMTRRLPPPALIS